MSTAHDYLATTWADFVSRNPAGMVEFYLTLAGSLLFFYIPSTTYLAIDLLFPAFSSKHKIQSERRQPTWPEIRHCIKTVVSTSLVQIVLLYSMLRLRGGPDFTHANYDVSPALPSLKRFVAETLYAEAAREVLFYFAHRTLHHPAIYRHIHKKHHTFKAPMAFAAQYAHPVEQILANVLPITLPLQLVHGHALSFFAFLAWTLYETATVHSGYDFGWPSAHHHDQHHEHFRMNYGVLPLGLDWLLGTDKLGWDKPKAVSGHADGKAAGKVVGKDE